MVVRAEEIEQQTSEDDVTEIDVGSFYFLPLDITESTAPQQQAQLKDTLTTTGSRESFKHEHPPATEVRHDADEKAIIASVDEKREDKINIATREDIEALQNRHPLPAVHGGSVSRIRYHVFSLYRRLMVIVLLANVVALAICIPMAVVGKLTFRQAATGTSANLFAATLMRHENYVNLVFWSITRTPNTAPLQLRRNLAEFAYSQGGIHSSSGISAFAWLLFYVILTCRHFPIGTAIGNAMAATSSITGLVIFSLIVSAHPLFRNRHHNTWETVHRYGGYIAIAMVWAQIIIISVVTSTNHHVGKALIETPAFWFLLIISGFIVHPYLYLRHLPVNAEKLSNHATRLWFENDTLPSCVGARLSHNPFLENHAFATIPNRGGQKGYSVIISNAGDWTNKMINNPPEKIWLKGAPTRGVLRIASLFKPIVIVTTGSGIGPCLSFLQAKATHPVRIIWSARFPEQTYGKEILASVLKADPNAIIIDTKATGQPDLNALTYALYRDIDAEAIAIISNPKVTRDVVYAMESRRVPAFGAIFDS
ncbi:MAG: hypothetical protein TREMPRED_003538 [Tremellales sp. Tagirdzhanova-0007]|nr:MAG: hypothetical protein TREMPRED_003538 [Tremellales sp. Tagirdzhanova-0007]